LIDYRLAQNKIRIALASAGDRDEIYRMRHDVFAQELGQHPENAGQTLTDALDEFNVYITAALNGGIVGFISITPRGSKYSIDKYAVLPECVRAGHFVESGQFPAYPLRQLWCGLAWLRVSEGTVDKKV
jgi:hypothetical protein